MGETVVTQELFQAVMGTNPSNSRGNKKACPEHSRQAFFVTFFIF
jgi:hypothetical protein